MSRSALSCPGSKTRALSPYFSTCVSCIKSSVVMLKEFLGCLKISPFIFLSNPGIVNFPPKNIVIMHNFYPKIWVTISF